MRRKLILISMMAPEDLHGKENIRGREDDIGGWNDYWITGWKD